MIPYEQITETVDAMEYWVFPNWCPWAGIANALQYRFRPNGDDPNTCIFDIRMMLPIGLGSRGMRPTGFPETTASESIETLSPVT